MQNALGIRQHKDYPADRAIALAGSYHQSGLHRHQSGRGIQGQDHGAQLALADRLHLSQDHGLGLVIPPPSPESVPSPARTGRRPRTSNLAARKTFRAFWSLADPKPSLRPVRDLLQERYLDLSSYQPYSAPAGSPCDRAAAPAKFVGSGKREFLRHSEARIRQLQRHLNQPLAHARYDKVDECAHFQREAVLSVVDQMHGSR